MIGIFHEYLYVRIKSLGDTFGYQETPEESVLEYIAKERVRLGEIYYPLHEHVEVRKVDIAPDKQFMFYVDYEDSTIQGLAICARKDILGNWFVSDSMRNGTFSSWRGESCRTTRDEEICTKRSYSKTEIADYIAGQMAKVSQAMMENRCNFKNYEYDPEYIEFIKVKANN